MSRRPDVGLVLTHRLRRWPNSEPTLGQRLTFAVNTVTDTIGKNTSQLLYSAWCDAARISEWRGWSDQCSGTDGTLRTTNTDRDERSSWYQKGIWEIQCLFPSKHKTFV